jgi:hypothetical protein
MLVDEVAKKRNIHYCDQKSKGMFSLNEHLSHKKSFFVLVGECCIL